MRDKWFKMRLKLPYRRDQPGEALHGELEQRRLGCRGAQKIKIIILIIKIEGHVVRCRWDMGGMWVLGAELDGPSECVCPRIWVKDVNTSPRILSFSLI